MLPCHISLILEGFFRLRQYRDHGVFLRISDEAYPGREELVVILAMYAEVFTHTRMMGSFEDPFRQSVGKQTELFLCFPMFPRFYSTSSLPRVSSQLRTVAKFLRAR